MSEVTVVRDVVHVVTAGNTSVVRLISRGPQGIPGVVTNSPELAAIDALDSAAGGVPYFTGAGAAALTAATALGRTLLGAVNVAAVMTALGLGTMAVQNANAVAVTGGSLAGITTLTPDADSTRSLGASASRFGTVYTRFVDSVGNTLVLNSTAGINLNQSGVTKVALTSTGRVLIGAADDGATLLQVAGQVSSTALLLPNNTGTVYFRNFANSAYVVGLFLDVNNVLQLGQGASGVQTGQPVSINGAATFSLGTGTFNMAGGLFASSAPEGTTGVLYNFIRNGAAYTLATSKQFNFNSAMTIWGDGHVSVPGRVLMGTTVDDTVNALQVAGNVAATGLGMGATATATYPIEMLTTSTGGIRLRGSAIGGPSILLDATNATPGNRYPAISFAHNGTSVFQLGTRAGDSFHVFGVALNTNAITVRPTGEVCIGGPQGSGVGSTSMAGAALVANAAGRVMIGTAGIDDSANLLQVAGKVKFTDGAGSMTFQNVNQQNLVVTGTNAAVIANSTSGNFPGFELQASGTRAGLLGVDAGTNYNFTLTALQSTASLTFAAGGNTEAMRINAARRVLIGTVTDSDNTQPYKMVIRHPGSGGQTDETGGLMITTNQAFSANKALLGIVNSGLLDTLSAPSRNKQTLYAENNATVSASNFQTTLNSNVTFYQGLSAVNLNALNLNLYTKTVNITNTVGQQVNAQSYFYVQGTSGGAAASLFQAVSFYSRGQFGTTNASVTSLIDFWAGPWVGMSVAGNSVGTRIGLYMDFDNTNTTTAWGVYQASNTVKNYFNGRSLHGTLSDDLVNLIQVGGGVTMTGGLFAGGSSAIGGTAIASNVSLSVGSNAIDPAGFTTGLSAFRTMVLTAPNAQTVLGGSFNASASANNFAHTGIMKGLIGQTSNANINVSSTHVGVEGLVYNVGAGTITAAAAGYFSFQNLVAGGTITTATALKVGTGFNNGTIGTFYSLYLETLPPATVKWGVYQMDATARNYFNGRTLHGTVTDNGTDLVQIAGGMSFTGTVTGTSGGNTALLTGAALTFRNGGSGVLQLTQGGATLARVSMYNSADLVFDAAGVTQLMLLKNSGRLIIGNVADNGIDLLQVNGSTAVAGAIKGAAGASFGNAALATTATSGFLSIPSMAGAPTGAPAGVPTGQIPLVMNTVDQKLYAYIGGVWYASGAFGPP